MYQTIYHIYRDEILGLHVPNYMSYNHIMDIALLDLLNSNGTGVMA